MKWSGTDIFNQFNQEDLYIYIKTWFYLTQSEATFKMYIVCFQFLSLFFQIQFFITALMNIHSLSMAVLLDKTTTAYIFSCLKIFNTKIYLLDITRPTVLQCQAPLSTML